MGKRGLAFSLCVCILVTIMCCPAACAAVQSNWYIDSYSSQLTISNGQVRVDFSTYNDRIMSSIGASKVSLYEDGDLVATFYSSSTPNMVGTNTCYYYGYVTYPANSGSFDYAVVTHYAADSSGSGVEYTYPAS